MLANQCTQTLQTFCNIAKEHIKCDFFLSQTLVDFVVVLGNCSNFERQKRKLNTSDMISQFASIYRGSSVWAPIISPFVATFEKWNNHTTDLRFQVGLIGNCQSSFPHQLVWNMVLSISQSYIKFSNTSKLIYHLHLGMFILQVLAMNDQVPFSRLEGTTSNVLPLIISLEWSSKYHWYLPVQFFEVYW